MTQSTKRYFNSSLYHRKGKFSVIFLATEGVKKTWSKSENMQSILFQGESMSCQISNLTLNSHRSGVIRENSIREWKETERNEEREIYRARERERGRSGEGEFRSITIEFPDNTRQLGSVLYIKSRQNRKEYNCI